MFKRWWVRSSKRQERPIYFCRPDINGQPPTPKSTTSNWLYDEWVKCVEVGSINETVDRTIFWLKEFKGTYACEMETKDKEEVEMLIAHLEKIVK